MFDSFEPFLRVKKQNFTFIPSRYETWMGGKMIDSGRTSGKISAAVSIQDGKEIIIVSYTDLNLNHELAENNTFDEFITGNDRLELMIIPITTNVECMGILAAKMTIGPTRSFKNFARNEPYCCNLFLTNGLIVKITFSFSNPEKLIEFYI